jgi:polyhydroxyalkanoate synthesis regulator phasin
MQSLEGELAKKAEASKTEAEEKITEALKQKVEEITKLEQQNEELKAQISRLEQQVKEMSTPLEGAVDPKSLEQELKKYKVQNENL